MQNNLAIVFPGQGSQSVGMLADIAVANPQVKACYDEASQILQYDLWKLVQEGPASQLDQTQHTQPAILVGSYAIYQILTQQYGVKPAILAGHSLGEYTALLCAHALSFADAVKLVAARGEYMQQAVQPGVGAMAAIIGFDELALRNLCEQVASTMQAVVAPANYNSTGQVVIAGHAQAVEEVIRLAKQQGARMAIIIPVSVPSHCALMAPAATQLASLLATITINQPDLPIINNVDVAQYRDAAMIKDGLVRQLTSPVRWVETIQTMQRLGSTGFIECGPGKVLTGLIKRIDSNLTLHSTQDLTTMQALLAS